MPYAANASAQRAGPTFDGGIAKAKLGLPHWQELVVAPYAANASAQRASPTFDNGIAKANWELPHPTSD